MPKHLRKRQNRGRHRNRTYLYRRLAYIQAAVATVLTAGVIGSSLSLNSALGTSAHAAYISQQQKTIEVDNTIRTHPYSFAASDGSNITTFMPIWYIGKALESLGIHQSWNGVDHTWTLTTADGTKASAIPTGHGQAAVLVNGQTVKRIIYRVARDPATGANAIPTVYMPIYYVDEVLKAIGIDASWNGKTWHVWSSNGASPLSATGLSGTSPVLFGFVTSYSGSTASLDDLKAHGTLTAFATPTFSITANGRLAGQIDSTAEQYAARNHLDAYITISNYSSSHGNFDGQMTKQLLSNATDRAFLVSQIVKLVQGTSFQGVNIDFELMPPSSQAELVQFLSELSTKLHGVGKQLNVDVPGVTNGSSGYDYAAIGKAADDVIVMAYDYSYPGGPAGAIAPLWWVKKVAAYAVTQIPADEVILGIPTYGYDWHSGTTTALSLPAIDNLLAAKHITPQWDSTDATPYFTYTAGSTKHTVFFENKKSLTDKLNVAREDGLRGISIWRMGLENAAAWSAINTYANY